MNTSFGRGHCSHNNSLPSNQNSTTKPQHRHQSEVSLSKVSESFILGYFNHSDSAGVYLQDWPFSHTCQIGIVELNARGATDLVHTSRANLLHLMRRHIECNWKNNEVENLSTGMTGGKYLCFDSTEDRGDAKS